MVNKSAGIGALVLGPSVDNIEAQFQSAEQNLMDQMYSNRDNMRTAQSSFTSFLQQLTQSVIINHMNDFSPLTSKDINTALTALIAQMKTDTQTVNKPTQTTTVTTAAGNTGNGVVAASNTNPMGNQLDYMLADSVSITCSSDSTGSATAGQEPFTVLGQTAEADLLFWDYPLGSGANTSISAINAAVGQGANILNNSSFDTATVANTPDNWTIAVGTAGTSIFDETSSFITTGKQLRFHGNSNELTEIYQKFNQSSGGTSSNLAQRTVYCLNGWFKTPVACTGTLIIELTDNSNVVIQNDQAVNQRFTLDISTLTTSYVAHNFFFQTPLALPTATTPYRIRIRMSVGINSTNDLDIDHLSLTPATQLYPGGPYVACFSGSTAFITNDLFTLATTNKYDGLFQLYLERTLGLRNLGATFQIASSASPSINDNLITA